MLSSSEVVVLMDWLLAMDGMIVGDLLPLMNGSLWLDSLVWFVGGTFEI